MRGSRKYPYPYLKGSFGNSEEEGVLKAKSLKESMHLNWNFQRGGGFKPKKPSVGGV